MLDIDIGIISKYNIIFLILCYNIIIFFSYYTTININLK